MIKNSVRQKQKRADPWRWTEETINMEKLDIDILDGVVDVKRFVNDIYVVLVFYFVGGTVRLTIMDENKRHDWTDYQRIKDTLLGEDWEGVEIFPARRLVVDRINAYHLWCRPYPFKIGWRDGGTYAADEAFFTSVLPIDTAKLM